MKIDRLISVIMILLERPRISITELAELCEVSPRTISRDIETINMSGIPVVSYPGLNGGVGILDTYKIEKRIFSTADITTLLMGLGCIRSSLSSEEVVSAIAKIKGFIPEEHRREIELRAGRLTIDMSPWVRDSNNMEVIELIQQAMDENRIVEFCYTDRMGQKSSRSAEPYRLILKGVRWYMDAYCLTREGFRVFKLSRITEFTLSDKRFVPKEYHVAATIRPEFQDKDIVAVKLFMKEKVRDEFIDYYGEDCIIQNCGSGFIAGLTLPNGKIGYQMLLRFGSDCECLEPISYRTEFKRYLQDLCDLYNSDDVK